MKALKHSLSLFVIILVILCCNQSSVQEGFITVKNYTPDTLGYPYVDLESHKSGDVEIQRSIHP